MRRNADYGRSGWNRLLADALSYGQKYGLSASEAGLLLNGWVYLRPSVRFGNARCDERLFALLLRKTEAASKLFTFCDKRFDALVGGVEACKWRTEPDTKKLPHGLVSNAVRKILFYGEWPVELGFPNGDSRPPVAFAALTDSQLRELTVLPFGGVLSIPDLYALQVRTRTRKTTLRRLKHRLSEGFRIVISTNLLKPSQIVELLPHVCGEDAKSLLRGHGAARLRLESSVRQVLKDQRMRT